MPVDQWARVRLDAECRLRRGAWYRVMRLTSVEAVVEVRHSPVSVPRAALQIVPRAPQTWSIVPRPRNSARLPAAWGARYAVCPSCHERAALGRASSSLRCPRCNGVFEIGWGDDVY